MDNIAGHSVTTIKASTYIIVGTILESIETNGLEKTLDDLRNNIDFDKFKRMVDSNNLAIYGVHRKKASFQSCWNGLLDALSEISMEEE